MATSAHKKKIIMPTSEAVFAASCRLNGVASPGKAEACILKKSIACAYISLMMKDLYDLDLMIIVPKKGSYR